MPISLPEISNRLRDHLGDVPAVFALVDTARQELTVVTDSRPSTVYPVSTSRFGLGNREGSFQTPPGIHRVAAKIGHDAPRGAIFRAREDSGRQWAGEESADDLILTRILRLEGLEDGANRGPGIDSFDRLIYIHGTNHEGRIGTPDSHGCIRMRNNDVLEVFDRLHEGTIVVIA